MFSFAVLDVDYIFAASEELQGNLQTVVAEMSLKEKLIEELEVSQRRLQVMKSDYLFGHVCCTGQVFVVFDLIRSSNQVSLDKSLFLLKFC